MHAESWSRPGPQGNVSGSCRAVRPPFELGGDNTSEAVTGMNQRGEGLPVQRVAGADCVAACLAATKPEAKAPAS
jgi:hypothetical protein